MKQTNYTKNWTDEVMLEKYKKFKCVIGSDNGQLISIVSNTPKRFIKILDIGGGNGEKFIQVAKTLIENGKDFSIDYLDVSKQQLYGFLKNMQREGLTEKIRYVELIPWQRETSLATEKYDVVLAIHSWYGIDNWKENTPNNTLKKVKDCLKEDGVAYIVVQRKGVLLESIIRSINPQGITTGEDISRALKKLEVKHKLEDFQGNKIRISELLKGEELIPIGKDVISYLLMIYSNMDFNDLSKEQKARIVEVIQEKSKNPNYALNDLITIFP